VLNKYSNAAMLVHLIFSAQYFLMLLCNIITLVFENMALRMITVYADVQSSTCVKLYF